MNSTGDRIESKQQAAPNVDPAEIDKFGSMASRWWDRHGDFKPLHDINPLRLNYIDSQHRIEGLDVLDVGCGGGILSEALNKRGATVTGIDLSDEALSVASVIWPQIALRYLWPNYTYWKVVTTLITSAFQLKTSLQKTKMHLMSSPALKCLSTYRIRQARWQHARPWSNPVDQYFSRPSIAIRRAGCLRS